MLAKLAEKLPQEMARLNASVAERRFQQATPQAHSLKGTAANLSAEELRKTAGELEMACRNCDAPAADRCLSAVHVQVGRCLQFIKHRSVQIKYESPSLAGQLEVSK